MLCVLYGSATIHSHNFKASDLKQKNETMKIIDKTFYDNGMKIFVYTCLLVRLLIRFITCSSGICANAFGVKLAVASMLISLIFMIVPR